MGLTEGQKRAFDAVKSGDNVFITGPGGTGKSYLLDLVCKWAFDDEKNVVICAPTGIAAVRVGGCTVHKALCIGPTDPIERREAPNLFFKSPIWKCDILIVDEISMCRIDLFEYMVNCIIQVNEERRVKKTGRGPIQVVLVGDFYQLPPVITDSDKKMLEQLYGDSLNNGYCLGSKPWRALRLNEVELTEVVRQDDAEFVDALNRCRYGDVSGLNWIIDRSASSPVDGAIKLSGTNREVDSENSARLDEIDSSPVYFRADVTGNVNVGSRIVPDKIELKVGARVLLVANMEDMVHVNGSMGYVVGFQQGGVDVLFDGEDSAYNVQRFTWDIKEPKVVGEKIVYETAGSYTQIPLKLAWAITIHKSQGQTFPAVNLNPRCWEFGQLYTALSRVSDVSGLYFTEPVSEFYLKAPQFPRPIDNDAVSFWYSVGQLAVKGYESACNGRNDEFAYMEQLKAIVGRRIDHIGSDGM